MLVYRPHQTLIGQELTPHCSHSLPLHVPPSTSLAALFPAYPLVSAEVEWYLSSKCFLKLRPAHTIHLCKNPKFLVFTKTVSKNKMMIITPWVHPRVNVLLHADDSLWVPDHASHLLCTLPWFPERSSIHVNPGQPAGALCISGGPECQVRF